MIADLSPTTITPERQGRGSPPPREATPSETAVSRVAAEPRLVRRAVEGDERLTSIAGLIERIEADESGRDFHGDSSHRILHVKAAEAGASVALVDRLARTARCAGRRNAPAHRAVAQPDFRFDRRAAARIPNAPTDKRLDDRLAHRNSPLVPRSPLPLALVRPEGASKGAPADADLATLSGPSFETRCCASLLRMRVTRHFVSLLSARRWSAPG